MTQRMCTKCHIRPRYLSRVLCEECLIANMGPSYKAVLEEELARSVEPSAIDPDVTYRMGMMWGVWLALKWALIGYILIIIARCVLDVVQ
jgi:hypothetical protein